MMTKYLGPKKRQWFVCETEAQRKELAHKIANIASMTDVTQMRDAIERVKEIFPGSEVLDVKPKNRLTF